MQLNDVLASALILASIFACHPVRERAVWQPSQIAEPRTVALSDAETEVRRESRLFPPLLGMRFPRMGLAEEVVDDVFALPAGQECLEDGATCSEGACGPATSSTVVAIDFTGKSSRYNVVEDRMQYIAIAAWSDEIEFNRHTYLDNPIDWSTRYRAYRLGGDAAITEWKLDSVPSFGTLYEETAALSAGDTVSDPDALVYVPDRSYTGADSFGYCVTDSSGRSEVATVELEVFESSNYASVRPVGIPVPVGIADEPPPDPKEWPSSEAIGFYYFDANAPNCTDENVYGYPDVPRCDLSRNTNALIVPSGAKAVFKAGVYTTRSSSWQQFKLLGSAGKTAWLVGVNNGPDQPIIRSDNLSIPAHFDARFLGSNFVIDGLRFEGIKLDHVGTLDGPYKVVRHSTIAFAKNRSGNTVSLANDQADVVYFGIKGQTNGFMEPDLSRERDVHFISTNSAASLWFLESLSYEAAGDTFQMQNNNKTQIAYMGHVKCHSDGENCVDIKDNQFVVVSENDAWDYRQVKYGNSGGNGQNFYVNDEGTQGTVWFVNNRSWDTGGSGISTRSIGGDHYIVGNVVFEVGNGITSNGGGGNKRVYLNTIGECRNDCIFSFATTAPVYEFGANYVHEDDREPAFHVRLASEGSQDIFDDDRFSDADRAIRTGHGSNRNPSQIVGLASFAAKTGFEVNAVAGVSAALENTTRYRYKITSPASDLVDRVSRRALVSVIKQFQTDTGDALTDRDGDLRPLTKIDVGADEYVP